MSTDAFAAAVSKGAALHKPRFSEALRAGLIFGVVEALAPVVGWALGSAAARHSFWLLAATGFATSIDAMAVGVSLAFIDNNIVVTALAVGLATLLMVTLGVMVGRIIGIIVGRRAEMLGGVALIGIGATILYEHLGTTY